MRRRLRKAFGWFLATSPFVGLIVWMAIERSLFDAVAVVGGAIVVAAVMIRGIFLISETDTGDDDGD